MSRLLRVGALALTVLLLVSAGVVLGFFLLKNAQWTALRIPTLRWSWESPVAVVEYEAPLAAIMLVSCAVGFLVGLLVFLPSVLRRAVERSRERRFIRTLEGELTDLRNLPINGPAPLEDIVETPAEQLGAPGASVKPEEEEQALLAASLQEEDLNAGGRTRPDQPREPRR